MHPEHLQHLALDHQAALLADAALVRAGRPNGTRPRRRWLGGITRRHRP